MAMPVVYMVGSFFASWLTLWAPIDRIVLAGGFVSASGGLMQLAFGLGIGGIDAEPAHVLGAFAISNLGTGLMLACCYAQALNTATPSYAGAAAALSGFIHMGWAFILTFAVATVAHETSLPLGVAQMTTTGLSLMTALLLVFVFRRYPSPGA